MNKRGWKNFWKNFWFVFWRDDSFKGWVISIIFLFIIIKGLFFPILEITTGTALPLVIVESCSMYHQGGAFSNFNNWWETHDEKYQKFDLDKTIFQDFTLKKGFNKGDILFITKAKPDKLKLGDIIIFDANYKNPIIHRVIKIEQTSQGKIFSTIGDNNNGQLPIETRISESQLIGKASIKLVPYAGWIKLIFFENARSSSERGFCHEN